MLEKEIPRRERREEQGKGGYDTEKISFFFFLHLVRSGLDPFLQLVGNFFFCFVLTGITFQIKSLY